MKNIPILLFLLQLSFSQDHEFNIANLEIKIITIPNSTKESFHFSKDSIFYEYIREIKNQKAVIRSNRSYPISNKNINKFMTLFNEMIGSHAEYKVKNEHYKDDGIVSDLIYKIDDYTFRLEYVYQQHEGLFALIKNYRNH